MTALIGALPLLATFAVLQQFPTLGALSLTIIHLSLMVVGAWLFSHIFGG